MTFTQKDEDSELPLYMLVADVSVAFVLRGRKYTVQIKRGFITDLASLPWFARMIWNANDPETLLAAVVHDALYKTCGGRYSNEHVTLVGGMIDREASDSVLSEIMQNTGCGEFRCWAYFKAVSYGGGSKWQTYDTQQALAKR